MSYPESLERYAALGVDTEQALQTLAKTPISLHCWQGDDVNGFEGSTGDSGGIAATGNYPGRARTPEELRSDMNKAGSLIPGAKRLNLHAIYADAPEIPDRTELTSEHFRPWIEWAKEQQFGLDFNPTCFGHPMAESGFTLSSADSRIRQYWIDHCIACRKIAADIGEELRNPVVTNIWIPDGYKDVPVDRAAPRQRLEESLDTVLAADVSKEWNIDAVESKLFGIGVESYTVGSHEFYLGYAVKNQICLCLDAGHFHPTESIAEKISSALQFVPSLLTHVSRGVRWDSDHVVLLDDPTKAIFEEIVRCDALDRTHIGLDFFDASINRIAAWVIGTRASQKSLLLALLEPTDELRKLEAEGDYTGRLALLEATKSLPWSEVWNEHCRRSGVPLDTDWMKDVRTYEKEVLSGRV
ncbi:L-rhamnose isomerase [Puniceicoccus vermicola]|uniref:L-rhamnose isomerase n=1 Tax=Puniceicoccus vermicola TaxID=388746 RepID=A0A7X1AXL3_9BACT|nr:L-rhamnose isomerase [Puniceicoccus vermicola]MBC2601871.1 L-rhamnose isomerase [Puniceicoccus vermicola]